MSRAAGTFATIAAILLLAFGLRLASVETRPLWYDDAFSVLLAERGPADIAAGTAADTMPPGYYLILYGWMKLLGQTPMAMRMLSVGLSLLTVAMVYAIAKRAFGMRTGLWAAFLAAVMPFQIYHAQELRMYTLLSFGLLIYLYGLLELMLTGSTRVPHKPIAFVAAGTTLALYAHNLAFVTLAAGNVYFIVQALRGKQAWRKELYLILGQAVGLALFTPWLFYVPTQLEKIQRAFWTQAPGLLDVVQMLMVFTTYLPLPPLFIVGALGLSVFVLVVVIWQLFKLRQSGRVPALGLFVTFALVPPVLLFALSYVIRPVFVPRAVIGSALVYAILIAVCAALAPRWLKWALAAAALGAAAIVLPFYYSAYGEWRRAPYAEADAFLRREWKDGDVILHDNKLAFFPMHLYDRTLPSSFLADPPQSDNDTFARASQDAMGLHPTDFDKAVKGHQRVWFVIFQTAIEEARAAGVPHANMARLDKRFVHGPETSYGDVRVVLYTAR